MDISLSPLRTLDDFLLVSARFQIPNYRNLDKWGNRVVNNLLYYQTNYFLTAVIIFLLVGFFHPLKFISGMIVLLLGCYIYGYISKEHGVAARFKKEHPIIGIILVLISVYFLVYMLTSVFVFLFGILLPIVLIFLHASLRLRNIKNKISSKMEIVVGLKKTPMGIFLDAIECDRLPPTEVSDKLKMEKLLLK